MISIPSQYYNTPNTSSPLTKLATTFLCSSFKTYPNLLEEHFYQHACFNCYNVTVDIWQQNKSPRIATLQRP